MSVFIIAEAGSSHDNDLQKAYRLIEAAKECGSSAIKFQWTSNSYAMAVRRGLGQAAADMYGKYLQKPVSWLESLKAHCDKVGIEFMCTVYLIEDIATIAPLVKRMKVSAFESEWTEFKKANRETGKEVICSTNSYSSGAHPVYKWLWCVSKYPTPIEQANLRRIAGLDGLSDHTANVLTGAAAVAAGAKIVEAHIKLRDTDPSNPDFPHSLVATPHADHRYLESDYDFSVYVKNIRTVERML